MECISNMIMLREYHCAFDNIIQLPSFRRKPREKHMLDRPLGQKVLYFLLCIASIIQSSDHRE